MSLDRSFDKNVSVSRREFLRNAALGVAALPLIAAVAHADPFQDAAKPTPPGKGMKNPYAPFRMGIQSYSLRHFNTDEMLAKTKALGLTYLEAYPAHFPITDDTAALNGYKDKLKANGITLVAYGVVDFSKDEADARKKFEFAKAMGVETLSASPSMDSFDVLDKMVDEYKINIAIHNHGPGDRYDTLEKIQAAVKGHNPRIGSCIDTGHFLRSNVDPVLVARELGPRVFDVHLKNVKQGANGQKEFTEIGVPGGLLDTVALLRKLNEDHYKGLVALEYEEHEENPIPQITECLAATQRFTQTVRKVGLVPRNGQ